MSGQRRRAPYRGVLFDLDGTLVDTLELILESYRHTMARHLGFRPPDEEWIRTMGTPLREQLADFAESAEQLESMFGTYLAHNQAHHDRLVRPFPRTRDVVRALRDAGYRLGIVTSKLRGNARRELQTCNLTGLFDVLVAADDVRRPKPDAEPVRRGLAGLDLDPEAALLVGDSIYDLRAGRAAGVDTAAALWGPFDRATLEPAQPDHWLADIGALPALLGMDSDGHG